MGFMREDCQQTRPNTLSTGVPTAATPSVPVALDYRFICVTLSLSSSPLSISRISIKRKYKSPSKLSKSSHEFPNSNTPPSIYFSLDTLSEKNKKECLISSSYKFRHNLARSSYHFCDYKSVSLLTTYD